MELLGREMKEAVLPDAKKKKKKKERHPSTVASAKAESRNWAEYSVIQTCFEGHDVLCLSSMRALNLGRFAETLRHDC